VWNTEYEEREMTHMTNRVNKISKSVQERSNLPLRNEQEAMDVAWIA